MCSVSLHKTACHPKVTGRAGYCIYDPLRPSTMALRRASMASQPGCVNREETGLQHTRRGSDSFSAQEVWEW